MRTINTKKIVGVLAMEREVPQVLDPNSEPFQHDVNIRKKLIDKINENEDSVVFGIFPPLNTKNQDEKLLSDEEKASLLQQIRMSDEIVIQDEFMPDKYVNFVLEACAMLDRPVKIADKNQQMKLAQNTPVTKDINFEFSRKPVIGIIGKNQPDLDPATGEPIMNEDNSYRSTTDTIVRRDMVKCFNDLGCCTIGIMSNDPQNPINGFCGDTWKDKIPSQKEQEKLVKQIEMCDMVVLQGGIESEAYEVWIARYCYDHDIPCLGFCAGRNNMVRALDGTTNRMLAGKSPEEIKEIKKKHYSAGFGVENAHKAFITKESNLRSIIGQEEIDVNSWHLRAIDDGCIKNTSLKPLAYDDENNIEICADTNKRLYFATQFHPELIYKANEPVKKMMDWTTEVAKKYMYEKQQNMHKQAESDTATALAYRKLYGVNNDQLSITKELLKLSTNARKL